MNWGNVRYNKNYDRYWDEIHALILYTTWNKGKYQICIIKKKTGTDHRYAVVLL
jgi:hypothetical protein